MIHEQLPSQVENTQKSNPPNRTDGAALVEHHTNHAAPEDPSHAAPDDMSENQESQRIEWLNHEIAERLVDYKRARDQYLFDSLANRAPASQFNELGAMRQALVNLNQQYRELQGTNHPYLEATGEQSLVGSSNRAEWASSQTWQCALEYNQLQILNIQLALNYISQFKTLISARQELQELHSLHPNYKRSRRVELENFIRSWEQSAVDLEIRLRQYQSERAMLEERVGDPHSGASVEVVSEDERAEQQKILEDTIQLAESVISNMQQLEVSNSGASSQIDQLQSTIDRAKRRLSNLHPPQKVSPTYDKTIRP